MLRPLFAALVVAIPSTARAYDIKLTSTGAPLRWRGGEIALELALADGPATPTPAESIAAAQAAVATWQHVLDGSDVTLAVEESGAAATAATGDGIPSVRWAIEEGDLGAEYGLLALTEISYSVADGAIQDADVVVNGVEFAFTVASTGCADEYDLESTLTHELGHLLGLAHSAAPDATMFATGGACETLKRDLSPDDEGGLDHLYRELPPLAVEREETETLVEAKGCAAGVGSGEGELALPVLLAFVIGLAHARRRVAIVRRTGAVGGALLALAVLAAPAAAGELRRLELADIGGRADLVVRGVVVASRPAAGGELATDSEVRVTGCFAGDCPPVVQVRRRGGEQAGRGLWVDGEAELRTGEEVILYVGKRRDGHHHVIGGVQGVLRVVRHDGLTFAVRDLRGHRVLADGAWQRGELQRVELADVRRSVEP